MTLIAYLGNNLIKIIEGIRHSGKTQMLRRLEDFLHANGISEASVLYIDGDSMTFRGADLYQYVVRNLRPLEKTYLLLDEVISYDYEALFIELLKHSNLEVIVASSSVLSLPNLPGKYLKIYTYCPSFRFLYPAGDINSNYQDYVKCRGAKREMEGLFYTIICKDTLSWNPKLSFEIIAALVRSLVVLFGQTFSWRRVIEVIQKSYPSITRKQLLTYFDFLERSHLVYRIQRYDIVKKEELEATGAYYFGHHGLIYPLDPHAHQTLVSRNIIYLELKRRNYKVFLANRNEVKYDFIAYKDNNWIVLKIVEKLYNRYEISQVRSIKGNYKRYILVIDSLSLPVVNDIFILPIGKFLLKEDFLD